METAIKRIYGNFSGVDFISEPSLVSINRSPDALNVWKNYSSTQGSCIETRPGLMKMAKIGNEKVYEIHIFNKTTAIVHCGNQLVAWKNFPGEPAQENLEIIYDKMNKSKSSFYMFENKLYVKDGKNYLVYDGETIKTVDNTNPYIPTTTIGRNPSGGGELYQDVNLLQPYRKNSFLADGKATEYYLDSNNIDQDGEIKVFVNDVEVPNTDYQVNYTVGRISFLEPPATPDLDGRDNVIIQFKKTVEGYKERIFNCTIAIVFDRRIFFSGNPEFPNAIFHSELEDPSYISDLSYYQDGSDSSQIKSLTVGNNILWVFKDNDQQNANIFYHIPTIDNEHGKIYPGKQGNVATGCYGTSINFNDDIVFISRNGLEGISGDILSEQLLSHRSSLVDSKLTNTNNFSESVLVEWNGYLIILVDKYIFLADSRQKFQNMNSFEYEWYVWEFNNNPSIVKEYKNELYMGNDKGEIFKVSGTNDNGEGFISYWSTPMDNFGYNNMQKTTNKRRGNRVASLITPETDCFCC